MPTYSLHGFTFASERRLGEHEVDGGRPADVTLRWGAEIEVVRWEGRIAADASPFYRVLCTTSGYVMAVADVAEFVIPSTLDAIEVRARAGASAELVDLLLAGTAIATLLALRGECVLHAAAVDVEGRAVVIPGPSGAGKTTLAAALCSAGGLLISDDVLRLSSRQDGASVVYPGTRALRLRESAMGLSTLVTGSRRLTTDGRLAVASARTEHCVLPVETIILPRHSSDSAPVFRTMAPQAALLELLPLERTLGWRLPGPHRKHFTRCAEMVASASTYMALLPRLPADAALGREALRQMGVNS